MTHPLHTVAHGLRTVATGIHLTFVPAVVGGMFMSCAGRGEPLLLALGLSLIGVIVTVVGRCFCLRTPPEMSAARARIFLAVILDLTGLGSTAALVVIQLAMSPIPSIVGWIGLGFSTVALVTGRLMFLAFLHALANSIGKTPHTAEVRPAILCSILAGGCLGVSYGAVLCIGQWGYPEGYFRSALLIGGFSCLILGVLWWWVYTRTLNRLSEAVEVFAAESTTDADSPDHEYRTRYPADVTDDDLS